MIDLIFAELTYLHGAEWPPLSMNHTSAFQACKKFKKGWSRSCFAFPIGITVRILECCCFKNTNSRIFLDFLVIKRDVLNSYGLIRTFNFKDKCNLRNKIKKKYYIFRKIARQTIWKKKSFKSKSSSVLTWLVKKCHFSPTWLQSMTVKASKVDHWFRNTGRW